MNDLPSDPARLRAILAYLDQEVTDNETVGIYLRIQRDTVHKALTRTENPPPKHHGPIPKGGANLPALAPPTAQTGYVVQHRRGPQGPGPAVIHAEAARVVAESADDLLVCLVDGTRPCVYDELTDSYDCSQCGPSPGKPG
ncbi:hypothetical protein [Streptomyces gibsoniae]|uniref:Transposase n=1 Tax=Streptomyces gibsoniae TaxID=3075529 RepID=A0ABU2U1W5_9ACTN|nr:hypothetical protein [Streptomyces sp. DSM 41699]MDT0467110.1 hypothetical protein [Streptomyces sp. DSM 41699]